MKHLIILVFLAISIMGCENKASNIAIPQPTKVTYSGVELSVDEIHKLEVLLHSLKPVKREITTKADSCILFFAKDKKEPVPLSIFLDEGILYEGYFQDAWTDRMQGKSSLCYKLDKNTKRFLSRLLEK